VSAFRSEVIIVDAVRSARGRGSDKGSLKGMLPTHLLSQTLNALVKRNNAQDQLAQVSDVLIGCVTQTGVQGSNLAKLAVIEAGWPDQIPAATINRFCTSSLSALGYGALQVQACESLGVAGGVEMMSRVPMASDQGLLTHDLQWTQRHGLVNIGLAADAVASLENFSREALDQYALASQQRAATAQQEARGKSLIAVEDEAGRALLQTDETPRPGTTAQSLAALEPAFARFGEKSGQSAFLKEELSLPALHYSHTAGNSPATADGASAVLLGSAALVKKAGLSARAKLLAVAEVSEGRTIALTGAVEASRQVLACAGLRADEIDLFEVNESFAALMLHYMGHLGVPHEKLNVNGGAIALGHAMGSTGTALVSTALDELERSGGRYALIAACGATGLASAVIIERLSA
jgi:acetyl-CoA C-acetyltransferase